MQKLEQFITVAPDGAWSLELANNFTAGFHAYIVESLDTGLKDVGFFMIHQLPKILGRVDVPPILSFGILTLLSLIIFLSWFAVHNEHERKHFRRIIFVSSVCVIISLVIVFGLDRNYHLAGLPERIDKIQQQINEEIVHTASGSVISPLDNSYQSGVDLTAKEVTIKTGSSGKYNFSQIDLAQPVILTHPNLRKVISYKLKADQNTIYFDVAMYNKIIEHLEYTNNAFKAAQQLEVERVEVLKENQVRVELSDNEAFTLESNSNSEWNIIP